MRFVVLLGALGLLASAPAYSQSANADEQAVLKAYHALDHGQFKKDRATMERLMADDYSYTHSNGEVNDKSADIKETMSEDIKWTDSKSEDLKVRMYGDVAVVTGQLTLTGSAQNYVAGPRRFTEIWVKHGGRWLNVGGQTTLVPSK
ncbi:MAG TPA: nuclear transport factor 2 family protein [Propionibacteriaceae bacterium]|nr:nuclear transport factor 2 family protein [Propionibacteriaceae bacterium]